MEDLEAKNLSILSNNQLGFIPLALILVVAVASGLVVGGSAALDYLQKDYGESAINVDKAIKESPLYLDKNRLKSSKIEGFAVGTVLLPDGSFSAFRVLDARLESRNYSKTSYYKDETKISFLSGDVALGQFGTRINPFYLKDGTKLDAITVDRLIAKLVLKNGQTVPVKIIKGEVKEGKLTGLFYARTYSSGYLIVGEVDDLGDIIAASVTLGTEKSNEAQTIIAKEALSLFDEIAFSQTPYVSKGEGEKETISLSEDTQKGVLGAEDLDIDESLRPYYDSKKGVWSFGGAVVSPSTSQVSNILNYVQQTIPQQVSEIVREQIETIRIEGGISDIESDSTRLSVSTQNTVSNLSLDLTSLTEANLANGAVTSAKIKDGEVKTDDLADGAVTSAKISDNTIATADIADGAVTSSKIANDTITTADLASTLTFGDDEFIDLASITHNDSGLQGLRLPNVSSASPTSPSSGEGFLAYDTSGNQVIFYNGSSWGAVGSGDITSVTAGVGLLGGGTSGDLTLTVDATTSGTTTATSSNSGLEADATGISLLRGCAADEILKWNNTSKIWQCSSDVGAGGAGIATIQENDTNKVTSATVIDFLGADFIVTDAGAGEGDIQIDYPNSKITRSDQAETITGGWTFNTASTIFTTAIDVNTASTIAGLTVDGGSLTLSGLTTDITTGTNDVLTISPSGTGNVLINPNAGGQAALIIDKLGSNDIFSASASGVTKFTIGSGGALTFAGGQTSDIDTLTGTTLKIGASTATTITIGRSTQGITLPGFLTCTLKTDGSGVLTCGSDLQGSGGGAFTELLGAIVPLNSTEDFLIGSQATISARFRVTADILGAGTLGVASISGKTSFATLVVNNDGVGDLFTASASGTNKFTIQNNGLILAPTYNAAGCTLKADTNGLITCGTDLQGGGGGGGAFTELAGAIVPLNSTEDFLVGGQATDSAKFAILNVNGSASPIASISATTASGGDGNGVVLGANATIQSLRNNLLTIGGNTTGNIDISPLNGGAGSLLTVNALTTTLNGTTTLNATSLTTINGGATAINFSEFDVDAGNGGVTINDAGNLGFINIESTILDIDSLTFVGAGLLSSGGANALSLDTGGAAAINIGSTTNATSVSLCNSANCDTLTLANNADADTITIGDGLDTFSIASTALDVSTTGAVSGVTTLAASGDITWSATTPTITINAAETFTISNGTAADNFVYNTSTNALTIGDGTNGLTFDIDTGMTYQGSGRPTKTITLSPEYAGAVLTASGSAAASGSMTSDASPSANFRTYYEWSSTQASLNDYTVAVRVTLPGDFSAWTSSSTTMQISYSTDSSVASTNKLDVLVYNPSTSTSTPVVYKQANVSTSWTTVNVANTDLEDSPAWSTAGQTATIYLKMYASGTVNKTRVGDIVLNYLSSF